MIPHGNHEARLRIDCCGIASVPFLAHSVVLVVHMYMCFRVIHILAAALKSHLWPVCYRDHNSVQIGDGLQGVYIIVLLTVGVWTSVRFRKHLKRLDATHLERKVLFCITFITANGILLLPNILVWTIFYSWVKPPSSWQHLLLRLMLALCVAGPGWACLYSVFSKSELLEKGSNPTLLPQRVVRLLLVVSRFKQDHALDQNRSPSGRVIYMKSQTKYTMDSEG